MCIVLFCIKTISEHLVRVNNRNLLNIIFVFSFGLLTSGSSRVSVGETSRPVTKGASLDHELVLRRHATSLRSQNNSVDDPIIVVTGKYVHLMFELGINLSHFPNHALPYS